MCMPVHCLAHYINLYLQEVAHKVKSIKEGLYFAVDKIQIIKLSPKEVILENVLREQESDHGSGMKSCARLDGLPLLVPCKP